MRGTKRERHESYGVIGISKINGNPGPLFGSHLAKHGHFISITIREASREHDENRDWIFGGKIITEVCMSAAQFAEFVTTPNVSSGVPCTVKFANGCSVSEPPPEITEADRIQSTFKERLSGLTDSIKAKAVRITSILDGKGAIKVADRAEIREYVLTIVRELSANLPYVVESFQDSVQKTTTHAKAEIDAMLAKVVHESGMRAIGESQDQTGIAKLLPPTSVAGDDDEG